ncbi:MAG: putative lipid II flippase FtsW [Gemmatimonadetes bacterium]|nr:putative lipid II flippase FtsW [Gemmatimonadota bacterium]
MKAAQRAGMHVLLICLVLVGLGIVMVYSSSSVLATIKFADSSFFLERQIIRAGIGILIMLVLICVPLRLWAKLSPYLLLAGLASLVLVSFFGEGPAKRWLPLPDLLSSFSFQPSEFVKLALVIYLADVLVRKEDEIQDFKTGFMPRLLLIGFVVGLIALQPDLGTALAVSTIALVMLWVGGGRSLHLLYTGLAALPIVGLSLYFSPYQLKRVLSFLNRGDAQGADYQVSQSLLALGNGGGIGVGIGDSMQKQQFLPEPHTDFVFAFIGEELGLAGTLSVIGLFVALAIHGFRIAREAPTRHGFLLATGITLMISVYAVLNIGVVTGMLPTTGLPLPFISYGGSSMFWNLSGIGILVGVARDSSAQPHSWQGSRQDRSFVQKSL